jgi:hypothetical protein
VLLFKVRMQYEIVRTDHEPERGPWRVSTRGYMYELQTASGELVWSYHWHPTSTIGSPHAHIGHTQLAPDAVLSYKAHHPTGRISLESVVRTCVADYGVIPRKDDWAEILARREADFEHHRTWSLPFPADLRRRRQRSRFRSQMITRCILAITSSYSGCAGGTA